MTRTYSACKSYTNYADNACKNMFVTDKNGDVFLKPRDSSSVATVNLIRYYPETGRSVLFSVTWDTKDWKVVKEC